MPVEPLDAGQLAAFVAAVDAGSVSAAADALELTQSAATKRIAALERRLGAACAWGATTAAALSSACSAVCASG